MNNLEFLRSWTLQEWTAETGMKTLDIREGAFGSFFACGTKKGQISRNWDTTKRAEETRISVCQNEHGTFFLLHYAGSAGDVLETYAW